jgi:hypothetical protein
VFPRSLAGKHRNLRRERYNVNACQCGNVRGNVCAAYGTAVDRSLTLGDSGGIAVAPGKAASAAVRARKQGADLPRERVFGNREELSEETQRQPQNQGKRKREKRGYKHNTHDMPPISPDRRNR